MVPSMSLPFQDGSTAVVGLRVVSSVVDDR